MDALDSAPTVAITAIEAISFIGISPSYWIIGIQRPFNQGKTLSR
jgi:hypothetical protein